MKNAAMLCAVLALVFAAPVMARGGGHGSRGSSSSTVHVKSHTTRNGTYVPAHNRTAPDQSKRNNWSTKGNVNPHTGKEGTKTPGK